MSIANIVYKIVNSKVSPSSYIAAGTSALIGVVAMLAAVADPGLAVFGILIIVGSVLTIVGFARHRVKPVRLGSLLCFFLYLFIAIFSIADGDFAAMAIIALPNILYFAYFYLSSKYSLFWYYDDEMDLADES
jgi:uncharacterized membrane protein YecN with MAPEG domain